MENLTQKDPVWRENGKAFVESVTRLLERLLDYRNVGQVSGIFRVFVSTFEETIHIRFRYVRQNGYLSIFGKFFPL